MALSALTGHGHVLLDAAFGRSVIT